MDWVDTLKGLTLGALLVAVGWLSHRYGLALQEVGKAFLRGKRVELSSVEVAVVQVFTVVFLSVGALMCFVGLLGFVAMAIHAVL